MAVSECKAHQGLYARKPFKTANLAWPDQDISAIQFVQQNSRMRERARQVNPTKMFYVTASNTNKFKILCVCLN